ncbi:hypothetical protein DFJ58DRAFT_780213 [Suillus subalutaceus]|uniref:uncharacterized protein n=1 Tax=Suillus subalutaceus TaxID=48586 RepID=UPI001B85C371|nr:uncharacterized protein DFJ58DRAFT_780213 [Suillus subalutaceus]KAG1859572.1 hypothetical protein DFJ58DRAFT_780213 [Suillus subalutaceus]
MSTAPLVLGSIFLVPLLHSPFSRLAAERPPFYSLSLFDHSPQIPVHFAAILLPFLPLTLLGHADNSVICNNIDLLGHKSSARFRCCAYSTFAALQYFFFAIMNCMSRIL